MPLETETNMRTRWLQQGAVKKALLAGAGGLLVVAAGSLLHYRQRRGTRRTGNEMTRRIACRDNLNLIYYALTYADENGELCPDKGLWQLWENGIFSTPSPLMCPSANSSPPGGPKDIADSCDYLFFPVPNWQRRPLPVILVCDRWGNHPGNVMNGLFADGLVLPVTVREIQTTEPSPQAIRNYFNVVRRNIAVISERLRRIGSAAQKAALDGKPVVLPDLVAQGYLPPESLFLPPAPSLAGSSTGDAEAQSLSPEYYLNPKVLEQPRGGTEPYVFQRARPQDVYLCCLYSDMKVRALCPINIPRCATVDDGVAYYSSSLWCGQIVVLQPFEIERIDALYPDPAVLGTQSTAPDAPSKTQ